MKNIYIINAHQYYPWAKGELNKTLAANAEDILKAKGMEVRSVKVEDGYDVSQEVENHVWADAVILQTPVYWMGVPWIFKKYVDEVFSAGRTGKLCDTDGRSSKSPKEGYGTGGKLTGKKYMLSLTYNAPKEAFNNPLEYLLQGKSADDMFLPMHLTYRFLGMEALESFVCYDVVKNPQIDDDLKRFEKHLAKLF